MAVRSFRDLLRRSEPDAPTAAPEPPHERCLSCGADLEGSKSFVRYRVCHSCGFHFHLTSAERLASLLDPGAFHEADRGVTALDPLSFGKRSYRSRILTAQKRTGLTEAACTGRGQVFGREIVVAVLDFAFLGGSIGVVAGERLARAFELASARRLPVVTVCSTSGTRMQEGLLALMQAPRVVAAARKHARLGLPHVAILADPTTGSAYSGFVSLADVIIAEPNALVGYAALRVLQEQEGHDLPLGAHTSESHLRLGLIDAVVPRPQLRDTLGLLLDLLMSDFRLSSHHGRTPGKLSHTPHSAWQQLQLSRHQERPASADFIARMTSSFIPLRGDRVGTDDPAVIAGLASLGGEAVMIVAQERSHASGALRGWIQPGGFRKAARAISLAGKFGIPVVTLIDTVGAHPGIESEEAGLGHAIATCMAALLEVPSPTIAVVVGEGNSEAAAAFAVADRVLMLDNAVYEVVRPEDAARILYREAGLASEAAERLRITSHDCLRLGIADATVPEPGEGAHTNHDEAALLLRRSLMRELAALRRQPEKRRLRRRYDRYREIGSTRSWVRGTLERRLAHFTEWLPGLLSRLTRRSGASREPFDDYPDIAI